LTAVAARPTESRRQDINLSISIRSGLLTLAPMLCRRHPVLPAADAAASALPWQPDDYAASRRRRRVDTLRYDVGWIHVLAGYTFRIPPDTSLSCLHVAYMIDLAVVRVKRKAADHFERLRKPVLNTCRLHNLSVRSDAFLLLCAD